MRRHREAVPVRAERGARCRRQSHRQDARSRPRVLARALRSRRDGGARLRDGRGPRRRAVRVGARRARPGLPGHVRHEAAHVLRRRLLARARRVRRPARRQGRADQRHGLRLRPARVRGVAPRQVADASPAAAVRGRRPHHAVRGRRDAGALRRLAPLLRPAAAHHHVRRHAGAPRPPPQPRRLDRGRRARAARHAVRHVAAIQARDRGGDARRVAVARPRVVRAVPHRHGARGPVRRRPRLSLGAQRRLRRSRSTGRSTTPASTNLRLELSDELPHYFQALPGEPPPSKTGFSERMRARLQYEGIVLAINDQPVTL